MIGDSQAHYVQTPPPAGAEDWCDADKAGLIVALTKQVEEQARLLDDMAQELQGRQQRRRSSAAAAGGTPLSAARIEQLAEIVREDEKEIKHWKAESTEAQQAVAALRNDLATAEAVLQEQFSINDEKTARVAQLEAELRDALCEVDVLTDKNHLLLSKLGVLQPAHERYAAEGKIAEQLTQTLSKVRAELSEGEARNMRMTATQLAEYKIVAQELEKEGAALSELMEEVHTLAVAASTDILDDSFALTMLQQEGEDENFATLTRSVSIVEHDTTQRLSTTQPRSVGARTAGYPVEVLATREEEWSDLMQKLKAVKVSSETDSILTDSKEVRQAYLTRLSKALDLFTAKSDEGEVIDTQALRREAQRIAREIQKESNCSLETILRHFATVLTSLRVAVVEVRSAAEVYGIQRRTIKALRDDLAVAKQTSDTFDAELARLSNELSAGAFAGGAAHVEMNVAQLEEQLEEANVRVEVVEAENRNIKAFMARLRLSDLDKSAIPRLAEALQ
ncbi:hypothetical protein DIPPA_06200 [Diplonema papillatum]|nr:hypothetical protein DIPPA_06200 [Diplonema papillatum]